jgi:EAL and modified HD-GYP domain-containing signal transduction protein
MSAPTMILARQPILAADGALFGYELLYRGERLDAADAGVTQSARVLCEGLGILGLGHLVGSARVFVNFDQSLLETDLAGVLPPGQGVVEILETVEPTARIFETLDELRRRGISIAVDDFLFQPNAMPFLPYVDFVKIDVLAASDVLDDVAHRLQAYNVSLIAEKVETHEQVERCRALGFQYFQGYFFARPEGINARRVGATEVGVVSLIGELQKPDSEAKEIAEKIGTDLALVHQILKLANSAAYRRRRSVESIVDAVVLLGQNVIQQWASLLLLSRLGDRKPSELLALALVRARMCQTLGAAHGGLGSSELFTVGLLSVLDALLDRPMKDLVAELPLSQLLCDALCGKSSSNLGDVLRRAIAHEAADWSALGPLTAGEETSLMRTYVDATQFARLALAT